MKMIPLNLLRTFIIAALLVGLFGAGSAAYASKGRAMSSTSIAKQQFEKNQLQNVNGFTQRQRIKQFVENVDVQALMRGQG